ncbi:MAG TPA: ArdC-like ssDNA-binding domain-containing protein [Planctomycetaceae bacterium]|nr:ArdC-like ssDNA-binding domain-containing protein [Planctomycetaceae bacterium]
MAKLYGHASDVGAAIVERFKNPASLPAPLAKVFIRRKDHAPCRNWSYGNQFIVAVHGYSEARGYRQWEEVGRHVKKGEKAIYILVPIIKRFEAEGDDGTTEEGSALVGFKSAAVFGLEQTDGAPLPVDEEAIAWLAGLPLREVAESWGIEIQSYDGTEGGRLGFYSCAGDRIGLGVRNLDVWAHELVHAADARNIGGLKSGQRVDQEVVAQLGAAILLTLIGQPVAADLGHSWAYVESYASKTGKATVDVCLELLNRTCKAVDLILTTAETLATSTAC